MIGVLSKPDQTSVVEELFELFKTPWEFFREGHPYDVVLVTSDRVPQVDARLVLVYGADSKSDDASKEHDAHVQQPGGTLNYHGSRVPIYGPLATFKNNDPGAHPVVTASGEAAALQVGAASGWKIRIGYDLFDEARRLLSDGQPAEHAHIPTLDLHIAMLRNWILSAGVSLMEILPTPHGYSFAVCLTHDIDFVGIRQHKFDRTMWGFLYRSTVGAVRDVLRRRISIDRLLRMWRAAASLPLVYLGWAKDFWEPFEWYLRVEKNLPATYYLIPFKGRTGDNVPGRRASRRATVYDVSDVRESTAALLASGCEIGVHGIDAWHSVAKGREELARLRGLANRTATGVRMHWLLWSERTPSVLETAGYAYDSTAGYNETIGYRNGTGQVFRPFGGASLLELPLHIQDGALFYRQQLDLSESEADSRCDALIDNAKQFGGVLTLLWHDRSHGPERFWGDFYVGLVHKLRAASCWFGTAGQVVGWFRKRREVRFGAVATANGPTSSLFYDGDEIVPPLVLRLYTAGAPDDEGFPVSTKSRFVDLAWNGQTSELADQFVQAPCASRELTSLSNRHEHASN